MQVPEWLLILLSIASIVLLIIAIFFLVSIIKNYVRRQKYEKVRPKGKYVPGKTIAYFKGNHEPIIPKTYPAVLNPGSSLVMPLSKARDHSSSVSSSASDHRNLVAQYAASQSIDEHFPRRSIKSRSGLEMKRIRSPLLCKDEHADSNVIRSGSFGGVSNKSDDILPVENCNTDTNAASVYSHSDLLAEVDKSEFTDSVDNPYVVSYDQDNAPTQIFSPGSLCFELEYQSSLAQLLIVVTRCLDLPPVKGDVNTPLNTYVNLCLVPEDFLWQRTKTIDNDRDPIYNENFQITDVLYHKLREYTLCFYIMDCNRVMGERVVGKVLYPLSDLRADNRLDVCKELSPP